MNNQFAASLWMFMIATTIIPLFYGLDGNQTFVAGG
jgi:hypothetical protein